MYIFFRIILIISLCLISATGTELFCNSWLKKRKKENAEYSQGYTKILLTILGIGILGTIISVPFLLTF